MQNGLTERYAGVAEDCRIEFRVGDVVEALIADFDSAADFDQREAGLPAPSLGRRKTGVLSDTLWTAPSA